MRIEPTSWACDACAVHPPATRYDLPAMTSLAVVPAAPEALDLKSAGSFGLCELCAAIVDSGFQVSATLARHVVETNPKLASGDKDRRRTYRKILERFYDRILPLLENPRPCVKGDDPMDAKMVVDEAHAPPPPPPGMN